MCVLNVCADDHGSQRRVSEPLAQEKQAVLSHLPWVLRTTLGSSECSEPVSPYLLGTLSHVAQAGLKLTM